MGSNSDGALSNKKKYVNFRSRQRANMSFFIVVMFFAVFGIIVFTEIFLIDERGGRGVIVHHGSLTYHHHRRGGQDRDYEDALQSDDYISFRMNGPINPNNMDDSVRALLLNKAKVLPILMAGNDNDYNNNYKSSSNFNNIIMEQQLPPYPSEILPSNGNWQLVNGTRQKFNVFSAFYDNRKGQQRCIRIIGATKTRAPERVWCRLWYKTITNNATVYNSKTIPARVKIIRENWNLKYSACFVLCPLLLNDTVPFSVSIVGKINTKPTNLLNVIDNYNDKSSESRNKFAVCIKPLHFDYNRAFQILEFIELNRIMGVDHFIFYNHTIGQHVNCILNDYISKGVITLLPWQLNNMLSQKEIRTEGLFAALNDCLYRSMFSYSHVLLIDLDEFIVPRNNSTLPELIEFLNKRMNKIRTTGAYSFQNAFFYLQWSDDNSIYKQQKVIDNYNDVIVENLVTLKKTRRRSKLHPHKQRSKYICKPELVIEAGNHFVWEFLPGSGHGGTLNVPADQAILHHYRICEFGGNDCIKTASTVDRVTFKYARKLIETVQEQYLHFRNKCSLHDLVGQHSKLIRL